MELTLEIGKSPSPEIGKKGRLPLHKVYLSSEGSQFEFGVVLIL